MNEDPRLAWTHFDIGGRTVHSLKWGTLTIATTGANEEGRGGFDWWCHVGGTEPPGWAPDIEQAKRDAVRECWAAVKALGRAMKTMAEGENVA